MLTLLEKQLYNKHLIISRSQKNKPFKVRQNFEHIIDSAKFKHLNKLAILFKKHPEIDMDVFFSAPYQLYPDVDYFGLDYFASMRAIKSYTLYKKILTQRHPDLQIEEIRNSLKFIACFCIANNIYLHEYIFHKTADVFTWMKHYKENKINLYSVFCFQNVLSTATQVSSEIRTFFINDFVEKFSEFYTNYTNSTKVKPFFQKAYPLLTDFVNKQLSGSKNNVPSIKI
jgi:hypothetical protein